MSLGGGQIESGWVYHYNPALEDSFVMTKGRPVYTLRRTEEQDASQVIGAEHVRPYGNAGKMQLLLILIEVWKATTIKRQAAAAAAQKQTQAYCDEVAKLLPVQRKAVAKKKKA